MHSKLYRLLVVAIDTEFTSPFTADEGIAKICDLKELRQIDLKLICSTPCLQKGGWRLRRELCCWTCPCPSRGGSQKSSLGLCRQPLALRIRDRPADPGDHACSQCGSYPWRAVFGTPFGTDSLLGKKRCASHLSHNVSRLQWSRGTRLLSHDTFWVQQQHDMATFATKLPGCRAHVAGPPHRTTPRAERSGGMQPVGPTEHSRHCQPLACPPWPRGFKPTSIMSWEVSGTPDLHCEGFGAC